MVDPKLELKLFQSAKDLIAALEGCTPEQIPEIIFTDQAMPEMDGIQLLKWVKAHPKYHRIPVVMVTAESEEHRKKRAIALGAELYIEKPIQPEQVAYSLELAESKNAGAGVSRENELHFTEESMDRVGESTALLPALTPDNFQTLKRHLHTIKGGAYSFQYPVMGEFIHELERVAEKIEKKGLLQSEDASAIFSKSFDYIKAQLMAIREMKPVQFDVALLTKAISEFEKSPEDRAKEKAKHHEQGQGPKQEKPAGVVSNDGISTRIQNEKLNHLQDQVKKVIQCKNKLGHFSRMLSSEFTDEGFPKDLEKILEDLTETSGHLMDFFISLRVVPMAKFKDFVNQVVSEAGQKLQREIQLKFEMDETESMDHEVLSRLETATVHIVRNSADHGFDGRVNGNEINCIVKREEKDRFSVVIRDNGHGIDLERLRASVEKKGLFRPKFTESMTPEQLLDLVFVDGLTTRDEASEFSGRGVGLSAVREELKKLGGSIQVTSEKGKGTAFRIEVPRLFKL